MSISQGALTEKRTISRMMHAAAMEPLFLQKRFLWILTVPVTFLLCHYAPLPFLTIYAISLLPELIKCIFGGVLLRKTNWIRNITLS